VRYGLSRSFKVNENSVNRQPICDFLLVFYCNPLSLVWSPRKEVSFLGSRVWKCWSQKVDSQWVAIGENFVILWALSWHGTGMWQTDRQTGGQTTPPMPKSRSSAAERDTKTAVGWLLPDRTSNNRWIRRKNIPENNFIWSNDFNLVLNAINSFYRWLFWPWSVDVS